jgi:hypothetical protein
MPTTVLGPTKFPQTLSKREAVIPLAPLFGCTTQTTDPQVSPWVPVPAGASLQLALVITALVGTLNVFVETCNQINGAGVAVDPPRQIGYFRQTPGAALPSTMPMSGGQPCDNYIRVSSTPGQGGGQTASWTVAGNVITAPFSTTA